MMEAQAPAGPLIELNPRARAAVLGAVLLGLFLSALDQTVVGTALPRIVTDLHGSDLYTWVVTSYLLTSTITVPIYGKLSDVYGRKPLLLIGIGLFLGGSWLAGLSHNMTELILFRSFQGLGAGALFPISLAIIGDIFTPKERGRYQGLFGAVFGLSFIVGPFIGGWLTDNISWHWVFYVNMPIGIASLIAIIVALPNFHPTVVARARDLDYVGIALFTAGVVPVLLGLTNKGLTGSDGRLNNWTDLTVGGLIVLGLLILVAFVVVEMRAQHPIIPLDLFRDRTYAGSNLAVFVVSFGMFASIIFVPRYYQAVRGMSATESGYMMWPLLVGLMGASIGSGMLISKMGRYKRLILISMVVFMLGGFLMTHLQTHTPDVAAWAWMLVLGAGIGPTMAGFTVVVQNSAPIRQLGAATSTLTFLRQIGGSVGLAIAGTVFSQSFTQRLPGELARHGVPQPLAHTIASRGAGSGAGNLTGVGLAAELQHSLPPALHPLIPNIVAGIDDAFSHAIGQVFWLTFGAAVAAFLATLVIRDVPLRGREAPAKEAADVIPGAELPVEEPPEEAVATYGGPDGAG